MQALKNIIRSVVLASDSRLMRYYLPTVEYLVFPAELGLLCQHLTETDSLPGPILEIGCEQGRTTVFLNRHLEVIKSKRKYICIDTFDGFTTGDIEFEVRRRASDERFLAGQFRAGAKSTFEKTLKFNGIKRATVIQADVNHYDFSSVDEVSFCFIDVDLFRPVTSALHKIWPKMAVNGVIMVHDCAPEESNPYRGAYEAYTEFAAECGAAIDVQERFGILRKR